MSYLVFARKYRPQSFGEVSGQEPVITTLRNAIRSGRIAHAFLFAGPRGVGKTTTARLLARALNCATGPTDEPCGECPACIEVTEGHALDVLEIDGASNRGIDDVKALRESVQYSPARDRYKVVIIDEVHMLSTPAFNALLKTLEEPPPHAKFIFATTEIHKVPATILSRCQVYEFRRISFRETIARLREILEREKLKASDEALALLARESDGCMRDAQSALDQVVAFGGDEITAAIVRDVLGLVGNDVLFEAAGAVIAEDGAALLDLVERLTDRGTDLRQFAARLGEHFRNLLVARLSPEANRLINLGESDLERLAEQAKGLGEDECLRLLNLLAQGEEDLKRSSEPRFTLERVLLRLREARRLTPLPELIAAVAAGGPLPATLAARSEPTGRSSPSRPLPRPVAETASAPPAAAGPVAAGASAPTLATPARPATPAELPVPVTAASESPAASPPSPAAEPVAAPVAAPALPAPTPAPIARIATATASAGLSRRAMPQARGRAGAGSTAAASAPAADRAVGTEPSIPAHSTAPVDPAAKAAARERAKKDPSVSRMLDLFKGELVDASEPGPEQGDPS